jgi:hypothetical protein
MGKLAGKNSRRQLSAEDTVHGAVLSVDSQEEVDFVNWACEAHRLSVIQDFQYQPPPFGLFEAVWYDDQAGKQRCLFREHVYTPDFIVQFDPQAWPQLAKEFKVPLSASRLPSVSAYLDVKGTFAQHDGGRAFSLNQKWTWQKFGVYVSKVVPKAFCRKFGVAAASMKSRLTGKVRKMFIGY